MLPSRRPTDQVMAAADRAASIHSVVENDEPLPPRKGSFRLTVIRAETLVKRDKMLAPQPFVQVDCQNLRFKTASIKKSLDPEWETSFVFKDVPEGSKIVATVFDEMRMPAMLDPKAFLGEVTIPLSLDNVYTENAFLRSSRAFPESTTVTGTLWLQITPLADNQVGLTPVTSRASTSNESLLPPVPLPHGWELRETSTGRPYYIDHQSGVTTWTNPLAPENEQEPGIAEAAPPYFLAHGPALPSSPRL